MTGRFVLAIALAVAGFGCPRSGPVPVGPPHGRPSPGTSASWPLPPTDAERLFAEAPMTLVKAEHTAQGVAGAFKATAKFKGDARPLEVKWKPVDGADIDNWNNNPRKEIATYLVQRWFLAPRDYVVPATAMRCIPLDAYKRFDPAATATVPGTSCVLGMVSLWVQHVKVPEALYEPERFEDDANYAYHLSNFNLLAYLIEHRDGRSGNILVSEDAADRHVFAIDNGISFGGLIYNFLTTNWDTIRVPAIRREAVEKLRHLDHRELEALRVVAELRADRRGVLRPVKAGPAMDAERGVRIEGKRVQLGLTTAEIDAVSRRITALLDRVDRGELPVF